MPSGFQSLYNFTGNDDGSNPGPGVIVDNSGNLYGVGSGNGANFLGTVYEFSPNSNTLTVLHAFTHADGEIPTGTLTRDSNGNFYGTTELGGPGFSYGTAYELSSDAKTYTVLHGFDENYPAAPFGGLVMDSKGNLFGTASDNNGYYGGSVFELSPNGSGYTFTTLHTFTDGNDGAHPLAGVLLDSKGNIYGTATDGGAYGYGVVYKLSPNASGGYDFTTLHSFNLDVDGEGPSGNLVMDGSGNLYGTTSYGPFGSGGQGTVFELSSTGSSFSTLFAFNDSDGAGPAGGLLLDAQGNLYGTTTSGGTSGTAQEGTVFKLSPNGTGGYSLTTLYNFTGSDGAEPHSDLVADSNGNLYGTTRIEGTYNCGTIFEITNAISNTSTTTAANNASASFSTSTQDVTLTADVTSSAGAVNEGTVTFTVLQGNTVLGTATTSGTVSNGQASVGYALPAGLATGSYTIDAVYNPIPGLSSSSDDTHTLTINSASTTTAAGNATATFSTNTQDVTLRANVTSDAGPVNEGTVTFTLLQGSTVLGSATTSSTVNNGQASVTYTLPPNTAAGTYTIDAVYNPGPDFATSSDNTHTLAVAHANVTTTAANATLVLPDAQSVTLSASVADASFPSDTVDEGTVIFTVLAGQVAIGTPVQGTVSGGKASASFSWPTGQAAGVYTIAVRYVDSPTNFTDSGDTTASLTVQLVPLVTINPANQTVTAGQTATFTAAASGFPPPSVRWQVSTDNGKTWSTLSATSTTLTLSNVASSLNGDEYRAVFSNSAGSNASTAALLTVQTGPSFTSGNSAAFTAGQSGSFLVTATGYPTSKLVETGALPSGVTFTDNGNGTATLTGIPAAGTQGTYYFSITASNGVGSDVTQDFALTVNPAPAPPSPPSPPPSPPSSQPSPNQPPALQVPPLLALLGGFLKGAETISANGTETVTYGLFGFTLIVATYDGSGNFVSGSILGFTLPNSIWFV